MASFVCSIHFEKSQAFVFEVLSNLQGNKSVVVSDQLLQLQEILDWQNIVRSDVVRHVDSVYLILQLGIPDFGYFDNHRSYFENFRQVPNVVLHNRCNDLVPFESVLDLDSISDPSSLKQY